MSNLIDSNEHIPSRRSEIFFWIIAAAAMLLFPGRNALNVTEAAWAETMREMLIGKIWWGEPFNWQLTPAGPSPVCWVVLPLTKLFGFGEAALRLPNAAAALLMLFGTKALGKKLFNKTVSRLAGWMMLSSYGFLFWGRCAAPDMFCAACATLAVALFAQQEEESGFFRLLLFFLLCFAAGMSGGAAGFFIPLMLVLPYLFFSGKWRKFRVFHLLSAFLPALLAAAVPFYLMRQAAVPAPFVPPDAQFREIFGQNIRHSLSCFYVMETLWEFLLTLPRLMLPWTPFFLLGIYGMFRCWKTLSEKQKGMFAGLLLAFCFSALTGRHNWGDVLPLLPFAVLITAGGMLHNWTPFIWEKGVLKACSYIVIVFASLCVAAIVALPVWGRLFYTRVPLLFLLILPLCGLTVLAVMLLDELTKPVLGTFTGLPRKFAAPVLGATLLMIFAWSVLLPSLAGFRSTKPFCLELKQKLIGIPAGTMFFWLDRVPADLLFYLDRHEPMLDDPSESLEESQKILQKLIAENHGRNIVVFSKIRHAREDRSQQPQPLLEKHLEELEKTLHTAGFAEFHALKPDHIEPLPPFGKESSPRLAAWVLNIPETTEGKTK
ncbi:MAG: glycosyltransferase family 39 protein [Lentisphaeria bacterium]|nr:glycosyltransferase family 39 protein [Lentisphaeria bacterium]